MNKTMIKALMNVLERSWTIERAQAIIKAKDNYIPSSSYKHVAELLKKKDEIIAKKVAIESEIELYIKSLGITGLTSYSKLEDYMAKIRDKEIENKFPQFDFDACLDDLVIAANSENFDHTTYVNNYINKKLGNE